MSNLQSKIVPFLKKYSPVILIILVAVFFRFHKLASVPPGLYPDEAANGLDIIRMIDNHDFRVSYNTNGPREALFFYLQGAFVWLGHVTKWAALNFTPLSLRIAPAIIGVFTVWGAYLLGKEFFNRNVGLFTAAAMAVGSWHIQFSRNGFRAIMAPMALIFLFYYFLRAYKNEKTRDFILCGAWLAVGFYTYFAFRLIPLALIALMIYVFVTNKDFYKKNFKKIVFLTGAFLLVMIPMFVHFVNVPADILGRSSTSIFNPELNNGSAIKTLFGNILKTIGMFNFAGDPNWRHNVAGLPMLDIFAGAIMWIGVAISLWNWKKIENFILIMWFGAMTLPMILTAEGIPHALRVVGTLPVIYLWVGMGLGWIAERVKLKEAGPVGVLIVLLVSGLFSFDRYFVNFPKSVKAGGAYAEDMVSMANDINEAPENRRNILIAGEFGVKTIQFITRSTQHKYERYEVRDIKNINFTEGEYLKIFIQEDWYQEAVKELNLRGINYNFVPVKSEHNDSVIYHAYPHVTINVIYDK